MSDHVMVDRILAWNLDRPFRFAMTGGVHAGKTSLAKAYIESLEMLGIPCFGCLEIAVFDETRVRVGYDFYQIQTGMRRPFARKSLNDGHDAGMAQKYAFDDSIWPWFEAAYQNIPEGGVAFFDELGKLEASGLGMMRFVQSFIQASNHLRGTVMVCRQSELARICGYLGDWDWIEEV